MKALNTCQINHVYRFVSFTGEKSHHRHLTNLGLLPGTAVVLLTNQKNQPAIISFKGTKLALDQKIMALIQVTQHKNTTAQEVMTLDEISVGQLVQVVDFAATGAVKRRLMDMGLTKGTAIEINQYAPLGDPIEIRVRDYDLSLRKKEAALILVEKV